MDDIDFMDGMDEMDIRKPGFLLSVPNSAFRYVSQE